MSKFFEALTYSDPALASAALSQPEGKPEDPAIAAAIESVVAEPLRPAAPVEPVAAPSVKPPASRNEHRDPVPQPAARTLTAEPPPASSGRDALVDHLVVRELPARISSSAPILPFEGSHKIAAERYRMIRTKIIQHPRQPRMFCVSSASIGDGKSMNAINMAGALALKQNTKVLLVDCDFRRPVLARTLGIPQAPGLSEVLSGQLEWHEAVVRVAQMPNLYFMPAGESTSAPAELLDSARWKATCETFRKMFAYVVIDSAPVGLVTDYDLVQTVCDGVVFVARQDHSNRKQLLAVLETIPPERLVGVVMNCVTPWFLGKGMQYYSKPYEDMK